MEANLSIARSIARPSASSLAKALTQPAFGGGGIASSAEIELLDDDGVTALMDDDGTTYLADDT